MKDVLEQTVHYTLEYMLNGKSKNEPFSDDPCQAMSAEERANARYRFLASDTENVTYVCLRDANGQRLKNDFPNQRGKAA